MESNSDSNFKPDPDHSGKHSSGHSHKRHHRHSSSRNTTSENPYKYSKRPRLEDRPKREQQKKIESFLTKNILAIFGIIFIGGAIWFAIGTWKSMENSTVLSIEKSKNVELPLMAKVNSVSSLIFKSSPVQPTRNAPDTSFMLFLILTLVFILVSLGLSIRRKNILLKTMSFFTWILIGVLLLTRFFTTVDSAIFYGFTILSSLLFVLFFLSGFVDTYIGRSKWKYRAEYILILLNSLFYFLSILAILHKSGHSNYESVFVFLLSTLNLFAFYSTDNKNITYNKVPYLISALIITCSFLPLIFRMNPVIIFLSPLSVFLILFSKYSRNQTSVIFSIIAMLTMAVIYLYQWIFEFIPDILTRDGILNNGIFFKGLISSLFILLALAINNGYLKKSDISLKPKWLVKLNYLKFLKGLLLLVIYLSGYWVFNYLVQMIFKDERVNLLTWFSFNCLYFIFYIPHLARQRSSYFRMMLIIAMISGLAYFTIIHFNVLQLRNLYIETGEATIFLFLLHYIPLILLIGMLFTLLHYFKRAFPGKKILIKGFWIYFYLMCTFLLLSEFDHLAAIYRYHNGVMIDTNLFRTNKLPYSLLLILSSIIVIIVGFVVKSRFLRIFSLFILAGVLVKILVYDVGSLDPQAKMILFFIIGVVLLGISVFYPKIRRSFFQKDSPQLQENFSGIRKHRIKINRKRL